MWTIETEPLTGQEEGFSVRCIWNKGAGDEFLFTEIVAHDTTLGDLTALKQRAVEAREDMLARRGRVRRMVDSLTSLFNS